MENKKSYSQSQCWCFTWNNYTEENVKTLLNLPIDVVKYIVFGYETCPSTGTPHLQGFVEFIKNTRALGAKKILDPVLGKNSPIHMGDKDGNPSNAKLRDKAVIYCKKGEQPKEEYNSLGEKGPNYGLNAKFEEKLFSERKVNQGKRTDWTELRDFISEKPSYIEVLKEYPEYAIKYSAGIQKAINACAAEKNLTEIKEDFKSIKLREWQHILFCELQNKPDNRKIIWYVDKDGNTGKTFMCKFLKAHTNSLCVSNAKTADIAHAYNGQDIILFDFTRTMDEIVNYGVIESLKNGMIFSPKYDSIEKIFKTPHVVCFSNFEPKRAAFSADRWDIRYLSDINNNESKPVNDINISVGEPITPTVTITESTPDHIKELMSHGVHVNVDAVTGWINPVQKEPYSLMSKPIKETIINIAPYGPIVDIAPYGPIVDDYIKINNENDNTDNIGKALLSRSMDR